MTRQFIVDYVFADIKVPPKMPGKTRRHAGVEHPGVLRIEDFEDVESPSEVSKLDKINQNSYLAKLN